MNEHSPQTHWERVYASKAPHQVSWTQQVPQTSLDFIASLKLPKTAEIIDIGAGESSRRPSAGGRI